MIEKWFESFTLLKRNTESDGMGGQRCSSTAVLSFQGVLSYTCGGETKAAGQMMPEETPALLHEFDVTLSPNDYVRRDRDGAVYRVTGRTDSLRAPAFSGLRFAQVPVERVVLPC